MASRLQYTSAMSVRMTLTVPAIVFTLAALTIASQISLADSGACPEITRDSVGSLPLQVLIIRNSQWDTPTAPTHIADELKIVSRVLGLSIEPKIRYLEYPNAIVGFGNGEPEYGIPLLESLGSYDEPTLVFTGVARKKFFGLTTLLEILEAKYPVGVKTFSSPWYKSIPKEGIVILDSEIETNGRVIARELTHLLSGLTGFHNHSLRPGQLITRWRPAARSPIPGVPPF